jgi:hypothetical protein
MSYTSPINYAIPTLFQDIHSPANSKLHIRAADVTFD